MNRQSFLSNPVVMIFVFCLILGCVGEAYSQATSGTILGRVTDAQKAVVVGAGVSAKHEQTGIVREAQTNDEGDYAITNLPPGIYTVTIAQEGFTKSVSNDKRLEIDQKLRLDITLAVGNVTETVTVTTDVPLLQTQNSETGQVVDQRRIADLPLLGRNFLDLTRMTTGVTIGAGGNNTNIAVNGQREFGNSIQVDGIEITSNRNNDTNVRPSVDAVQEFKVSTSAYAPEFGRAAGGVIVIQTKSGGIGYHGSILSSRRHGGTRVSLTRAFRSEPA